MCALEKLRECVITHVLSIIVLLPLFVDLCLLPPVVPTGATVVCRVCFVLWVFPGPCLLFPALLSGSSESGPSCGWWDGPQPGSGGGLQGVSWWQLYIRHPAQVRMNGYWTLDNNILLFSLVLDNVCNICTIIAIINKIEIYVFPVVIHWKRNWAM